jgi:hypothetical protein
MSYWTHWRELSDYILPRRGRFLVTPNQGNRGDPKTQKIIDSTGTLAARTLSSGMMAGVTSPARPWFRLTVPDRKTGQRSSVKLWLDECQKRLLKVFAKSNFYNAIHVLYEEIGVFGTGVMLIEEDRQDVIRCRTMTAGEYYLAVGARLSVDTLYREFTMTVAQIVGQFGLEAASPTVCSLYASGQLDREIMVAQAIEPNDQVIEGRIGPAGMPYRSLYWELGSSQDDCLQIAGFHEMPFCAPRWHVIGNDAYGKSPGMEALGDIKSLQIEQKRKAQAIDKMVNPPMVADVQMKNEPATLLPGGVTYVASANGVGFKPVYEVNPPLAGLVEDIKEVQDRIKQCFFADLFLMISQLDTVRTATEITERKQEKLLMLGPVLERLHAELLDPAIERSFGILLRNGLLPPPPVELSGAPLTVEYVSTLADAQRAVATTGIERLVGFVGNLAAAKPEVLDTINFDETVDEYADMLGVSPKILVPDDQIQQIRAARAKQAQQQQAMQTAVAAAQGAKTLSQTDVGGGQNALQKMTGATGMG